MLGWGYFSQNMKITENTIKAIVDAVREEPVSEEEMFKFLEETVKDYNKATGRKVWSPRYKSVYKASRQWRTFGSTRIYMLPNRVVLAVTIDNNKYWILEHDKR